MTTTLRRSDRIKKYYKNNNISYMIEEYGEHEHRFIDTEYDTKSENSNEEKSANNITNSKLENKDIFIPVPVPVPVPVSKKISVPEENISSSLEEDATSYFNLITKKNITENFEEDEDYVLVN